MSVTLPVQCTNDGRGRNCRLRKNPRLSALTVIRNAVGAMNGTASASIAATSLWSAPGGSSTVVAAGSSRWIDSSGMPWLDVYQRGSPFSCTASATPAQLPSAGGAS